MRYEYKYLVPTEQLALLRSLMHPFIMPDKFASRMPGFEYTVRSVYYDTPNFKFYDEKIDGLKTRKKIRIRGYNQQQEDSKVFLEVKRKNDAIVRKNRFLVPFKDVNCILYDKEFFKSQQFEGNRDLFDLNCFLYNVHRFSLAPAVIVTYDREAYQSKFDPSLRITFDKNLRSKVYPRIEELFTDKQLEPVMTGYFVLEIKFSGGYPGWVRSIIRKLNLTRTSVSKYTICLDKHFSIFGKQQVYAFKFPGMFPGR